MSTISTDDSASSLSALLDQGAWVLARNQEVRDRWATLSQETLDLILTFRSHRFRPIAGADDLADRRDQIRRGLRAFASFGTAKTWVGPSRGAICDACGRNIAVDEIEYEIVARNGNEVRLDGDCYALLVNELATLPQDRDVAS